MRRKFFILPILFFFQLSINSAQGPKEELKKYLNHLLETDSLFIPSQFSICIKELETNKKLMSINAHRAMIPASNLKLLTTITALDLLGAEYKFSTKVFVNGKLENGILLGDVIIIGNGDPTLGSDKFNNNLAGNFLTQDIAKKIGALGITKINGNLIVLAPEEDRQPLPKSWPWGDIGNYYGAPSTSVNFMDNLYKINFKSDGVLGAPVSIESITPVLQNITITNLVKTGLPKSGDKSYVFTSPYSTSVLMNGTVAA